ncbi:amino acid permease family protein, partial [Xylogone sp. PMI_703]
VKKQFSIISIISLSFIICNSWAGISGSIQLSLLVGGPSTLIYSIIVSTVAYLSIAATLAELSSVYPTAGGQYHFASILAPPGFSKVISYTCGLLAIMSWIAIGATVTFVPAQQIFGIVSVYHSNYIPHAWHIFLAYEALGLIVLVFNVFALKKAPWLHNIGFFLTISLFITFLIGFCARHNPKAPNEWVWNTFINETGWPDGICFLVGLTTSCFMYIGLDASMHLAEECAEPKRDVPIAIMSAVTIGFLTAFPYAIAQLYAITDYMSLIETDGYIPYLVIQQGLNSKAMATVLAVLGIILAWFILNAIQETSSRLVWSFARDNGMLFSQYLGRIHPALEVPIYSLIFTWVLQSLCGFIYLGSSTAFNALANVAIVLQQLSFLIPAALLIYQKRSPKLLIQERTFRLPNWLGWVANIIVVLFGSLMAVILNLPITLPTSASTMNYCSAMLGFVMIFSTMNWFVHGRRHYHGPRIDL